MADYVISCCSTADVSMEWIQRRDISFIPFHVTVGGQEYADDFGQSIRPEELYKRMKAGETAVASGVTVDAFRKYFEEILAQGKDLIHVSVSSGISTSYNAAKLAKSDLSSRYPDRKIFVVDSLCASSGYGLLVDKLADLRDEGRSIGEILRYAEDNKGKIHHWFISSDLTYLSNSGRVSKMTGVFGNMLNICPLLDMNIEGKLIAKEKIRSKKKAMKRMLEKMIQYAEGRSNYKEKCFISHSLCEKDAREMAEMVEACFPQLNGGVQIYPIGAAIGAHTGPGTIAFFYWGDERKV